MPTGTRMKVTFWIGPCQRASHHDSLNSVPLASLWKVVDVPDVVTDNFRENRFEGERE
jgi:hypothetical protein